MLTFNPENHEYRFNGTVVPSVTTVLKSVGIPDLSFVDRNVLEKACAFGTSVHLACELWDKGTLDETDLDVELVPMLMQWKRLKNSVFDTHGEPDIVLNEIPLYSTRYRFAGTLDRGYLYVKTGTLVILDLKTGITAKQAPIQTSAYVELVKENSDVHVRKVIRYTAHILHDSEVGKLEEHKNPSDFYLFQSALNIYRFKNS